MFLHAIDALSGLRAALEEPAAERDAVFRMRVMEPTRPLWEPLLMRMRHGGPAADAVSPVVSALSEDEVEAVRPRFRAAVEVTGFDVIRGYMFGDWAAGYAG